jgi:hypothetical protein
MQAERPRMGQQSRKNSTSRHSGFMEATTQRMAASFWHEIPTYIRLELLCYDTGYAQPHLSSLLIH